MKWEEWLRSREAKRETLRRVGLDAPSRRKTSHSSSERRMRQAFGGLRAPAPASGGRIVRVSPDGTETEVKGGLS